MIPSFQKSSYTVFAHNKIIVARIVSFQPKVFSCLHLFKKKKSFFFTVTSSILLVNVVMTNEDWIYNLLHTAQNFFGFDVLILFGMGARWTHNNCRCAN